MKKERRCETMCNDLKYFTFLRKQPQQTRKRTNMISRSWLQPVLVSTCWFLPSSRLFLSRHCRGTHWVRPVWRRWVLQARVCCRLGQVDLAAVGWCTGTRRCAAARGSGVATPCLDQLDISSTARTPSCHLHRAPAVCGQLLAYPQGQAGVKVAGYSHGACVSCRSCLTLAAWGRCGRSLGYWKADSVISLCVCVC